MDEIWDEALNNKHRTLEEGRAWLQTAAEVWSKCILSPSDLVFSGIEYCVCGRAKYSCSFLTAPLIRLPQVNKGTWFEEDEGTPQHVDNHIQQKIIPWDKLDLVRRKR